MLDKSLVIGKTLVIGGYFIRIGRTSKPSTEMVVSKCG